jgi:hypothetical protein
MNGLEEDSLRELTLPEICGLSRLGVDLLMAPIPVREMTKEEKRRAVKSLGLIDPDAVYEMRTCTRCESEKPVTEFHLKGHDEAGPLYNRMCKQCCQVRQKYYRDLKKRQGLP